MVEYGCNVANRFGFASDDDDFEDPQELIVKVAKVEAEKLEAAKKAKNAPKVAPAPAKDTKAAAPPAGKDAGREKNAERGGRGRGRGRGGAGRPPREGGDLADRFGESTGRGRGGRGGRGGRPFRGRGGAAPGAGGEEAPKEVATEEGEVAPEAQAGEGFRVRRGGRGGFRGEGRGFRGGRGRQFDRQSGSDRTGVKGTDKKDGHGRGNWGDNKDELTGETEPLTEQPAAEEPEVPREKTQEELKYEADLAEYAKMKTLKEFKAAQKDESAAFKTRKAGEGAQENFGKLVPIQKPKDEKEEEEVIVVRKESSKKILNVDIHFAEPNRGGRDFGARGSPRGRGGARGGRGGRGGAAGGGGHRAAHHGGYEASTEEFPALGAK